MTEPAPPTRERHRSPTSTARRLAPALGLVLAGVSAPARAADVPADPSNYQQLVATLHPGDTLQLAAGTYTRITIDGVHGTSDAWITIEGPATGDPAIVLGESCCNTVQLYDSSFVAIRNLSIDLQGLEVDGVNAKDSVSHDILVENNTIQNFPAGSQQIVGINTKSTAFNWTIRGNTILEPGTGLYLGGSEGDTPFIAGVIENNLVVNSVGYDMQIKHQNDYAAPEGLAAGPHSTIIRNNVFIKDDRESPDGDRPNLLVGGFPDAGPGSEDLYEIYGNLLFYNPREALLQATGRVAIHDNIFVGSSAGIPALVVTSHQGKAVELMHVYNNTFYAQGTAISFSSAAAEDDAVVGNLIFAATPMSGTIADERDNLTASLAEAASYVNMPAAMLGAMDFYPLAGAVEGSALDLGKFTAQVDHDRDYNGTAKGGLTFRGAYAGAGDNPGCPLDAAIKDCGAGGDTGGDDGGASEGGTAADDSGGGETGAGATSTPTSGGGEASGGSDGADGSGTSAANDDGASGGCGCRSHAPSIPWLLAPFVLAIRRRARTSTSSSASTARRTCR